MKIFSILAKLSRTLVLRFSCHIAAALYFAMVHGGSAAPAFVYETAFEFQSDGDFDGDGRRDLIIVDKATGSYRIGYRLGDGSFNWASARASGIANAAGLAIGKLNSLTRDSLAVTGPEANRVNVLDATSAHSASLPASVFIPSLGPNLVAAIDLGGAGNTDLDDLYVTSIYNGANPYRESRLRTDTVPGATVLADHSVGFLRERANAVLLHTNRAAFLALFERNTAANRDTFELLDTSSGAATPIVLLPIPRLPMISEYVTGQFDTNNPLTQFLIYPPSTSTFSEYQVTESSGNYALVSSGAFTLTNVIDRLVVLPGPGGPKLLAVDLNGVCATVYDFDGLTVPVPRQAFTTATNEHFTGAGAWGDGGFTAYSAPLGQNTTAKFQQWNWNGTDWTAGASGDLPRVSPYTAAGNAMQFQSEPFVASNPRLLRLDNAGDWSSQPAFSGAPGNVAVRSETFLNSTQGLVNPTLVSLGPAHPQAAFVLANQYTNFISLFSFLPPAGDKISDVTIFPAPGLYPAAFKVQFAAANPDDTIYFRFAGGDWLTWSSGMTVWVFTNTTVQYYGQPAGGGHAKSAVKSATYTFTQGPSSLDSNNSGVPDYVKIALGLNVTGARDSDGDGYSDLEELIHGTNALDASSVPTNHPHVDDQAVFDLSTTPYPWDGLSNAPSLCLTGAVLRAYDLQGSLLSQATISNRYPAAQLTNIVIVNEDRLLVTATELHYSILTTNVDQTVGREMIGLVPLPATKLPEVNYAFGGSDLVTEAWNWIAAASNAFNNLPRAALTNSLTVTQTLKALLFELKTAQLLAGRGTNWWANLTLFPFRPTDAGRTNPSQATLLSLESRTASQPGYKLRTIYDSITNHLQPSAPADVSSLLAVVQDIYRIASVQNNTNPAKFVSPVDETRRFLWTGTMDSNYLAWAATAGQFAAAIRGARAILAAVPPRPTTNISLVVRSDTFGGSCPILDVLAAAGAFSLLDVSGVSYVFPASFRLLPGSVIQVFGYTDVDNPGCGPSLEVIFASLNSLPIATDTATGGLLLNSWEERFFGRVGVVNAFGPSACPGYSLLQQMLEGGNPRDPSSCPSVPAVQFSPPMLTLVQTNTQLEIHFQWPARYVNRFDFGVRESTAAAGPFSPVPASGPINVAGDEFKMILDAFNAQDFFCLTVSLR